MTCKREGGREKEGQSADERKGTPPHSQNLHVVQTVESNYM